MGLEGFTPVLGGKLLALLVGFRILNALTVRTSFTPDEFWQGPEVAHALAFRQGHLTWEWQASARIRGFTHPLIFAGVYRVLEVLGLDTRWAVAHSPKLLQGVMAGVCDYYTFGLSQVAFGTSAAGWALLFQILSWFNFYCLVRPYSNSAEAVLATASLYYWAPLIFPTAIERGNGVAVGRKGGRIEDPWPRETGALLLAAVCVAVRPTSAALWTAVGLLRMSTLPLRRLPRYLTLTVIPPVVAVVGASFYLDSWLYGTATLVPLNFLRFNVLEGQSRIFGEQAWHWNFSQGLPAVLGAALPLTLWGFVGGDSSSRGGWCARSGTPRVLGWLAVWFLGKKKLSVEVLWKIGIRNAEKRLRHRTACEASFLDTVRATCRYVWSASYGIQFVVYPPPLSRRAALTVLRRATHRSCFPFSSKALSPFALVVSVSAFVARFFASLHSLVFARASLYVTVYHSTSPHKEFRFLVPVLPIAHAYAGRAVAGALSRKVGGKVTEGQAVETNKPAEANPDPVLSRRKWRKGIAATTFFVHVPAAIYLSIWHQSGALSAVDIVARKIPVMALTKASCRTGEEASTAGGKSAELGGDEGQGDRVGLLKGEAKELNGRLVARAAAVIVHFLMPCHSAPLHSHLHFRDFDTELWSLDCSPENRARPEGSESDQFLNDPLAFLKATYGARSDSTNKWNLDPRLPPLPDLAVMYSTHLDKPGVADFLGELGLENAAVVFNAHVNGDADSDDMYDSVVVLEQVNCLADSRY